MHLSYSTINMVLEHPHCWLNKMMGFKPEEKPWMTEGREAHAIIQAHVSGKKLDDRLAYIGFHFPIVEETDFDPKCKFSFQFEGWEIIGFFDGLDPANKRFLEIKTSTEPWPISKYQQSYQRRLYSLARPEFTESILITGKRGPNTWKINQPKVYSLPLTDQDREEARVWLKKGIDFINAGDFTSDLVDGKCVDPRCYYGANCQFK